MATETETEKKVVSEAEELPRAIVRRLAKDKLAECSDGGDIALHKDALIAFSESARIFIHYLSATANDICKESKRQTINSDDVLKALEEIEFPEFVGSLKASLDEFRRKNAGKRTGAKERNKKRKAEDEPSYKHGRRKRKQDEEDEQNEENEDEDSTHDSD